jgi:hypothetical protein
MDKYLHRVVGLYPSRALGEAARDEILAHGLQPKQVRLIEPGSGVVGGDTVSDSDDVLKDILRDGAIGTAVGTAAGAGVSIGLAAANLTLFIASPVLGVLYLLGWGASLGGLVGAVVGSERSKGDVSSLIVDALASGQFVLVVYAYTEEQTSQAHQVIAASM